ncbi:MAG: flagellar motor protein MotB [Deltaproteobacteria bacterium]|nr:flagellar motor protein MotB [Deltaproteobacteria bacterium]
MYKNNSLKSRSEIHRKLGLAGLGKTNKFLMEKTLHFFAFAFVILVINVMFTSCVSSKKLVTSEARVDELQKDSSNTHNQLNACNAQIKNLTNDNAMTQSDLEALAAESNMTIAGQAKQLKDFKDMIQSQRDVLNKLKNSIADALMSYKADELSVYMKHGKVYVSLAEKLLFKSGSDVVDPKGKEALKTLTKVLNTTKDITVTIEGHTDDVPIKTKLIEDNWDLSTARATSIVRILTKDNSFDPSRITASGRSQYHPLNPNTTDEGRAGNRRTEVVLSPDLNEIYKLLYQ